MGEQVKCPICGRRLFDKVAESSGLISIKCNQCKQIAEVRLESKPKINLICAEPKES